VGSGCWHQGRVEDGSGGAGWFGRISLSAEFRVGGVKVFLRTEKKKDVVEGVVVVLRLR
jgi:hypothetical protein